MSKTFPALTLQRPWPWAIFFSTKDVENRHFPLPSKYKGAWVAIHAGKVFDDDAADYIWWDHTSEIPEESKHSTGVIGLVKFSHCVTQSNSPWFIGRYGFVISKKLILPKSYKINGQRGFWDVEIPNEYLNFKTVKEIDLESNLGRARQLYLMAKRGQLNGMTISAGGGRGKIPLAEFVFNWSDQLIGKDDSELEESPVVLKFTAIYRRIMKGKKGKQYV